MRRLLAAVALAALTVTTDPAAAAPGTYDMTCDLPGTSMPGGCKWETLPDRVFRVTASLSGLPGTAATLTATWSSPLVTPPASGPHLRLAATRAGTLAGPDVVVEARWRTATGRWSRWDRRALGTAAEWSARVPRGEQVMWQWRMLVTVARPSSTVTTAEIRHAVG